MCLYKCSPHSCRSLVHFSLSSCLLPLHIQPLDVPVPSIPSHLTCTSPIPQFLISSQYMYTPVPVQFFMFPASLPTCKVYFIYFNTTSSLHLFFTPVCLCLDSPCLLFLTSVMILTCDSSISFHGWLPAD